MRMRWTIITCLLPLSLFATTVLAFQDNLTSKTQLETMVRKNGVVVQSEVVEVGLLEGIDRSKIAVSAMKATNLATQEVRLGLATLVVSPRGKKIQQVYIDNSELNDLINAVDLIWNNRLKATPKKAVQVGYTTNGLFGVSFVEMQTPEGGELKDEDVRFVIVSAGGFFGMDSPLQIFDIDNHEDLDGTASFFKLESLRDLRELLVKGRNALGSI